jgi:phosphatidylglycerophosphate synthase
MMVLKALLTSEYPLTRYVGRPLTHPIAVRIGMKMSPNMITGIATTVGVGAGLAIALGNVLLGAVLTFTTFLFDCLDGEVARQTGRVTPLGEFLDATLDRIVDAVIIGAFIIFEPSVFLIPGLLLTASSFLVSYVRKVAASLNLECRIGLAGRDLRLVVLSLMATLLTLTTFYTWIVIWGLAITTAITVIHRIAYVAKRLREHDRK